MLSLSFELYCGLFNDRLLTVCFSLFLCFLVRVRCHRKKFTFAISSADEFLVFYSGDVNNEDSDDEAEQQSRTVCQKADRSHLIVWQVFTDG